jgi:hypothetical protein
MGQKPTYYVRFDFDPDQADRQKLMSRIRDFGETVLYNMRGEPSFGFDLDVIDAARTGFHFTATSELLAIKAAKRVSALLADANLIAEVTVSDRLKGS